MGASNSSIPLGAMIALVAIAVGGMIGVLWVLDLMAAAGIVLGGALVVGLLLVGVQALLRRKRAARAVPFIKRLTASNKGGAQQHQVEDLRRKFMEGIEIFKRHGKDVYSLPWYLVVGEPGTGKTEAIRHSDVRFPKGLQNKLQGTGGTVNMHWWFTFHAVILDTAGRLMFDSSSEWPDFLKLLKSFRQDAPINGMLLFIPADRLIKDSDQEIDKKAEQIANQMVQIQRALNVRFPVFVIVSKADLINGFREFFESIKDPGLQHQIMGWSNPEPIDAPYRGELIDDHFRTLSDRLRRRRLGLMMDPQVSMDPEGRPIDRLDSLYSFPESVARLAPRLRRYLDEVFTGDWSNKPPMLRGIYFTSSMREGAELDADLASALGVPVDALPGGRAWNKKDKAYFLRDVFMEKVFRERGLVTRSANAKRTHAMRRAAVYAASILTAVVLIGLTAWWSLDYQKRVGSHAALWSDASTLISGEPPAGAIIVNEAGSQRGFVYEGGLEVDMGGRRVTRAEAPGVLLEGISEPVRPPALLEMVRKADPELLEKRAEAARAYVDLTVVRPVIHAAREAIRLDQPIAGLAWNADAQAALEGLIALEKVTSHEQMGQWAHEYLASLPVHALSGAGADTSRIERYRETDAPELAEAIAEAYAGSGGPVARDAIWGTPDARKISLERGVLWAGADARREVAKLNFDGADDATQRKCDDLLQLIGKIERERRTIYERMQNDVVRALDRSSGESALRQVEAAMVGLNELGEQARGLLEGNAVFAEARTAWGEQYRSASARLETIHGWIGQGNPPGSPLGTAETRIEEQKRELTIEPLPGVRLSPQRFDAAVSRIQAGNVGGALADAVARANELISNQTAWNRFPAEMRDVMTRVDRETSND